MVHTPLSGVFGNCFTICCACATLLFIHEKIHRSKYFDACRHIYNANPSLQTTRKSVPPFGMLHRQLECKQIIFILSTRHKTVCGSVIDGSMRSAPDQPTKSLLCLKLAKLLRRVKIDSSGVRRLRLNKLWLIRECCWVMESREILVRYCALDASRKALKTFWFEILNYKNRETLLLWKFPNATDKRLRSRSIKLSSSHSILQRKSQHASMWRWCSSWRALRLICFGQISRSTWLRWCRTQATAPTVHCRM